MKKRFHKLSDLEHYLNRIYKYQRCFFSNNDIATSKAVESFREEIPGNYKIEVTQNLGWKSKTRKFKIYFDHEEDKTAFLLMNF